MNERCLYRQIDVVLKAIDFDLLGEKDQLHGVDTHPGSILVEIDKFLELVFIAM